MVWISPKHKDSDFPLPLKLENKIDIFEARVMGWQILIADEMSKIEHAGYAVISAIFSYFEMIAQYIEGQSSKGRSKEFFNKGFKKVFPGTLISDDQIGIIYDRVRNGMYHDGSTKVGVLIAWGFPRSVDYENDNVLVDPKKLTQEIKEHFGSYIDSIRDKTNVAGRTNFETIFDTGLG